MGKNSSSLLPKLAIIGIVGAIGGGYAWMNSEKFFPKSNEKKVEQPLITQEQWRKEDNSYKITWVHPTSAGQTGKVGFVVKLNKDKISSVDVNILTTNEKSKLYQESFKNELTKAVVGKKISELANIDVIGGASSTTKNFQEAVAALGAQLKI